MESRCPETLKVFLEVQSGRDHIVQCLTQELQSMQTFIHDVCQTPLVKLVELALKETELVLERKNLNDATPLMV